MRTLTPAALAEIATSLGTEPLNIVEVQWTDGVSTWYADKELTNIPGKILNLGTVECATTSKSTSVSFTVTLDDTDKTILNILNTQDVHKAICKLYQYFGDIALTDKFVLFQGELSSPITWDEGDRTVSFTALSSLEEKEVGFSPEEGEFDFVSPELEGEPWPLVFGNCLHVPAQKIKQVTSGTLAEDMGIVDPTLEYKLAVSKHAYDIQGMIWNYYGQVVVAANALAASPAELIYLFAAAIASEDILLATKELKRREVELERNLIAANTGAALEETIKAEANANLHKGIRDFAAIATLRSKLAIMVIKVAVKDQKEELKIVRKFKKLLMDEEKNTEYEQNVKNSAFAKQKDAFGRMQEIFMEYREIYSEICRQQRIVKTSVTITGGHNFVQNTSTDIVIAGARWRGTFDNDVFTLIGTEPIALYEDLQIGSIGEGDDCEVTLEMSRLDNFWLATYTNIKGHYLKVTSKKDYRTHIIQVVEQDGLKCRFKLIQRGKGGSKGSGPISSSQRFPKFKSSFGADVSRFIRDYNDEHSNKPSTPEEFQAEMNKPDDAGNDDAVAPEVQAVEPLAAEKFNIFQGELSADCMNIIIEGTNVGAKPVPFVLDSVLRKVLRDPEDVQTIKEHIQDNLKTLGKSDEVRFVNDHLDHRIEVPGAKNTLAYRINREEYTMLLNLDKLLFYSGFADVQIFLSPDPRALYTLIGPDIKEIKEVSIVPLVAWADNSVLFSEIPESAGWAASVGADIRDAVDTKEVYVANILPSVIKTVAAYRTVDNKKVLQTVPVSYYSKNESEAVGDITVTSIKLEHPLSFYDEEKWEETLYVSIESSVGPRIVDILKHIIETYTDKTWDATSFNAVETRFGDLYPANFALFDRKNAVNVLQEIAWQARCAIFEVGGIYHLKYLSEAPVVDKTITESDVESNSFKCLLTETENLTTKFVALWRENYLSGVKGNKIILRNNTIKYGVQQQEFDFYIFNIRDLVEKSATFWTIRYSNTWKSVQFKTFFTHLDLESYDTLDLNFITPLFANNGVRGVLESIQIDTDSKSFICNMWLPVRAGEMGEYEFAWPGDATAEAELSFEAKIVHVTGDITGE